MRNCPFPAIRKLDTEGRDGARGQRMHGRGAAYTRGLVGKIHFRDLNPDGFPRLGIAERDPNARLSWDPSDGTRAVKAHRLAHTDRLARAMFHRIDMAGHRGRLRRHAFEYILGPLKETLDAGIAVNPVTQWHRLVFFSVMHYGM